MGQRGDDHRDDDQCDDEILKQLASKYIWSKSPDDALRTPNRIIVQVMNVGDYDDILILTDQFGDNRLREALAGAEAGQFNKRSWHYWHYRLGLADIGQVPPLPARTLP
jgi:hypothetical protein